MNEANLVKRLNWLATGDSFLAERQIDAASAIRLVTTGLRIGDATSPTLEIVGAQFDDTDTAHLIIQIPQDYDPTGDLAALRLKVTPTGSNNTTLIKLTTAQSIYRAGSAVDATAVAGESTEGAQTASENSREAFLNISGRGYEPGDTVVLTLEADCNSGTDELIVGSIALVYGSCLAAHDDADRHRDIS